MKKGIIISIHRLCVSLLLLLAGAGAQAQPGGWAVDPAAYQYNMTMVAQIQVNGSPNYLTDNHLAVFSQGQIRGYAAPFSFMGQTYYFLNLYSKAYKGDTLYFRAFIGADQKVYESTDTVIFKHHQALGSIGEPYQVHLYLSDHPLIYSLSEVDYASNSCAEVLDVQATDNQNSEGNGLAYSISGGSDAARFSIHPQTGLLSWFNFSPNYASPADADGNNRYEVKAKVLDASGLFDEQQVTVTVQNSASPAPPVCPDNQSLHTDDDGAGDCGTTAAGLAALLANPCAASGLSYQLSGATAGEGDGQIPENQVFLKGLTTVTYIQAGAGECSFTVYVQDNESPSITCPDNRTVAPNVFGPCGAEVGGISAEFTDNCSGAGVSYELSGATTGYGSGQASGQTFLLGTTLVTYTVVDGADHYSNCTFTVTVTNCNTEFSGVILWEHDGVSGVQNTTVNLSGAATGNDLTDANGYYQITLPNYVTGNFTLHPVKSLNKLNGVTTADVTAIQQHAANASLLPAPFKRIAADVNKSNTITSLDATILNQALLGNQASLNQITSWRFVPATYVFPNPNVPWGFPEQITFNDVGGSIGGQNFKGIKLGDVVSTWADPASFGGGGSLMWRVQDEVLASGAEVVAEFRADQMSDLTSFQFALHFDPEQLQLLDIEPLSNFPIAKDHFGTYNAAEGEIRVAWAQAKGLLLGEATAVFRLRFKALESGARLSEVLQLNEAALPGHCYNSAFAESGVELHFAELTDVYQAAEAAALQVHPNPFRAYTTVSFELPGNTDVELRVTDATGRLLYSKKQYYAAGRHHETLHLEGISGVLYAALVTEWGSVVRKIVESQ